MKDTPMYQLYQRVAPRPDDFGRRRHLGVGADEERRHLETAHLLAEGRPKGGHALAVLPGLTHYNLGTSPLFAAVILDLLDGQQGQS
jgi:hypothetical protein